MKEWEVANLHGQTSDVYAYAMYDTGLNVLSMKINHLPQFKHKHKHQKFAHEN
jgi:hypothetical protein